MLKPATSDPNVNDAMERFKQKPDEFGPQEIMVAESQVITSMNESAHKVTRKPRNKK